MHHAQSVLLAALTFVVACGNGQLDGTDAQAGSDAASPPGDGTPRPDAERVDARPRPDAAPTTRTANPELVNIPDNTWRRIADSNAITAGGIGDYSGMAMDTTHGWLLLFGGGHASPYVGNAVWRFALDTTLSWAELAPPDPEAALLSCASTNNNYPGAIFYPQNETIAGARPSSRHTYDTLEWMPNVGRMVQGMGFTHVELWGCGGGDIHGNPNDMWQFDPAADFGQETGWTYQSAAPNLGTGDCAAYADSDEKLYWLGTDPGSQTRFYRYDAVVDSWTALSAPPIGAVHCTMTYVGSRNSIVVFGREYPDVSDLWEYSLPNGGWRNLSPSGFSPPDTGRWGLAWDSYNDVLVAVRGVQGESYTLIYDFGANTWTRMTPAGGAPRFYDMLGRVKYDPVNNVVLAVTDANYSYETWAYKYRR